MIGKLKDLAFSRNGEQILSVTLKTDISEMFDELKDYDVDIVIKRHRERRSLDANAMLWVMCEQIAQVINSTKEDVYREEIRQVGKYTPLPIKCEAVDEFQQIWSGRGVGWFVDVVDDSKIPGYKLVFAYHGSSTYDTKEMSRLIDNAVQDAKELGIVVMSEQERSLLLDEWESR